MIDIKTIVSKMGSMRPIGLIGLIILCCLTSCSGSDDFEEQGGAAGYALGGVSGYSSYFDESRDIQMTRSGEGLTRAWSVPTGYEAYENGAQPIAIAFTKDGDAPKMGYFFKIDDNWRTTVDITASTTYQLYGFIPNHPDIQYTITDGAGTNASYSAGAIMTLKDVPTVMDNDFCVVIGAKHGTDKEHDSGLRMGDFSFQSSQGEGGNDFVFLLFDHIYSSINIRLRVYDDYAEMRRIKLKSLKLCTKKGDDKTTEYTDVTINVHATDGSNPKESPISEPTFTPAGDEISDEGLEFWSDDAGYELTTSFQSFIGHFMPNGISDLVLTSTYDVYDKNITPEHPDGNLVRKDCQATNYMVLTDLITGQTATERGKRYVIDMTIMPTYLYVLSDPDLKNPVILNE